MIENLAEDVFGRLVDTDASETTIDLVLAALNGSQALNAAIDGSGTPARPDPTASRTAPSGTFLVRLAVRGSGGIGEEIALTTPPGPGLTVVAARNGSVKSSFSEVLECALTGSTGRWAHKLSHADFRYGRRNLRHPEPPEIAPSQSLAPTRPADSKCLRTSG